LEDDIFVPDGLKTEFFKRGKTLIEVLNIVIFCLMPNEKTISTIEYNAT
jgi:hypothetical protein